MTLTKEGVRTRVRFCETCESELIRSKHCRPAKYAKRRFCSRSCVTEGLHGSREERFWKKVDKTVGCWLWTGGTDGSHMDYGRVKDSVHNKAHRLSWELANSPIPQNMLVLHKCDVTLCVRPSHLFIGTHVDNARDKVNKGRQNTCRGETVGTSKLTEENVRDIRLRSANGESNISIAKRFSISASHVSSIVLRRTWAHVV